MWLTTYTRTYILYICTSVHVLAGNTSSASLQVGPGDIEWQQPCVSLDVGSRMIYFLLTAFILPINFVLLLKGLQSFPARSPDLCPSRSPVTWCCAHVSNQATVARFDHNIQV